MDCKVYMEKDLKGKNYVVTEWVEEDGMRYIVSLHETKEMADKRCKYLNRQAKTMFEKGIDSVAYGVHEISVELLRKCFNYELEEEH